MAIVLSGTTNDIMVNGVSVTTDADVSYAITDAVQTGLVALQTIATGAATFTATTNNIKLTGIGIGVEIGDVIQISGAEDTKNNTEFTVEVITDNNNIIVNQAHANKGTSKNVAARASDTGVTVKLLSKWYNASDGLGQDWVDITASRNFATAYANNTNRTIQASVVFSITAGNILSFVINGNIVQSGSGNSATDIWQSIGGAIGINSSYNSTISLGTTASKQNWLERR